MRRADLPGIILRDLIGLKTTHYEGRFTQDSRKVDPIGL